MSDILYPKDWQHYHPTFQPSEFECKCGCGLLITTKSHLDLLYKARKKAGIPFYITSGCRCLAHNKKEGGSSNSDHIYGEGTDILVVNSRARFQILEALIKTDFKRIGIGRTFIHAGTFGDNPQEVVWLY